MKTREQVKTTGAATGAAKSAKRADGAADATAKPTDGAADATAKPTDGAADATAKPTDGAARAVAADELDPGRERRPLESYFQEIGGTRTLRREEEVILAKELEAATADLRDALYQVPCCARHIV